MLDETKPLPLAEIVVRFEKSSCKLDSRLELADVDVGYVRNGKLHVPRGLYLKQEEYYLAKAEEALNCGSFGGLEPAWLVKAETTITVVVDLADNGLTEASAIVSSVIANASEITGWRMNMNIARVLEAQYTQCLNSFESLAVSFREQIMWTSIDNPLLLTALANVTLPKADSGWKTVPELCYLYVHRCFRGSSTVVLWLQCSAIRHEHDTHIFVGTAYGDFQNGVYRRRPGLDGTFVVSKGGQYYARCSNCHAYGPVCRMHGPYLVCSAWLRQLKTEPVDCNPGGNVTACHRYSVNVTAKGGLHCIQLHGSSILAISNLKELIIEIKNPRRQYRVSVPKDGMLELQLHTGDRITDLTSREFENCHGEDYMPLDFSAVPIKPHHEAEWIDDDASGELDAFFNTDNLWKIVLFTLVAVGCFVIVCYKAYVAIIKHRKP
ncbi:hypothetical protein AAVH_22599 [Aphelenchoides avenae]|nr:hypothetical protein AAVH_22599 [Aphelenchus avenae]